MGLERFRLLPLEPPAGLASEYERPCIMTAFMPLAMEKDLRWDLMATGSGSLSMRWTGVQDTMALQQRSCRLNTAEGEKMIYRPDCESANGTQTTQQKVIKGNQTAGAPPGFGSSGAKQKATWQLAANKQSRVTAEVFQLKNRR